MHVEREALYFYMRRDTLDTFIAKSKAKFGDKFGYSKAIYKNSKTTIIITCPIHGEIEVTPNQHLKSPCGCPKCGRLHGYEMNKIPQGNVLNQLHEICGDKFDFSNAKIDGMKNPIHVVCQHGHHFWQSPSDLVRGRGCDKCRALRMKTHLHGVGINDLDISSRSRAYQKWHGMFERCYNPKYQEKQPTYIGCYVCEEWKYLSNFKRWFDDNYIDGYELDKDILFKGNKVYSPDTCCFIPKEINGLFSRGIINGRKQGVTFNDGRYVARIQKRGKMCHIGKFKNKNEAYMAYMSAKKSYLHEIAKEYFNNGLISEMIYNAIIQYEIE